MNRLHTIFDIKQISSSEETHTIHIELNEAHEVFEGHFPDQPVLPGVVQLEMVKVCLERILERTLTTETIKNVKYLQIIDPRKLKSLQVEIKVKSVSEDSVAIAATINDGDLGLMKLSASYR